MKTIKLLSSKSFLLALFFVAAPSLAQPPASPDNEGPDKLVRDGLTRVYGVSISFVSSNATAGAAVSGVEVARTNDTLFIDTTPCLFNQPKRIFAFVKPYREGKLGDAKCDGKSYPQIQVIQQKG